MANAGIQLLGFTLAFLGFIGTIASTVLVEWKASSHSGDNIITAQALYEGLWKTCAWQSTGQVQCKVYDSLLQLPGGRPAAVEGEFRAAKASGVQGFQDFLCRSSDMLRLVGIVQGTRGLMLTSILLSFISIMVAVVGMRCTTCMEGQPQQKDKVALAGGVLFIIAGLFALVGTSWYGHRVAQDFHSPFTPTNSRYEFGSALYVGWGAACLGLIGGGFLCCNCSGNSGPGKALRYPPSSSEGGRDYV